jgi:hypothetical protein
MASAPSKSPPVEGDFLKTIGYNYFKKRIKVLPSGEGFRWCLADR